MVHIKTLRNSMVGLACVLLMQPVFCMDRGEIEENDKIVWNGVLDNRILFFPHDTVCALALVDKKHNKSIKETAIKRKEYVANILTKQKIGCVSSSVNWLTHLTWHIHGSAGACAYVNQASNGFSLVLSRFCLEREDMVIEKTVKCDEDAQDAGFINILPVVPHPFFNHKGEVCCYGITKVGSHGCSYDYEWERVVKEYLLKADGTRKIVVCVVAFSNEQPTMWDCFNCLIEFPMLLKAILHSEHVTENNDFKIYHLDGVTLPHDYATRAQDVQEGYLSFDLLPNLLRDAVNARYLAQENKD